MRDNTVIWWAIAIVALAMILWVITGTVRAQEIVVDNASIIAENSWLYGVWSIIQPVVTLVATIITPVLATWLAAQLIKLLRISDQNAQAALEAQFREALHHAALNALKYAVSKHPGVITDLSSVPPNVMKDAMEYIAGKNPDAAARLKPEDIADIILSKVPDLLAVVAAGRSAPSAPTIPLGNVTNN